MSWVSILEDAIKRFESDLHMLDKDVPLSPEAVTAQQWQRAVNLVARGQLILADATKHLELATDPSVDLAFQLKLSTADAQAWQARVADFQRTSLSLMAQVNSLEGEKKRLVAENARLRSERNSLTSKLEETVKTNPGGIYQAFSKGSHRKK